MRFDINTIIIIAACVAICIAALFGLSRPSAFTANPPAPAALTRTLEETDAFATSPDLVYWLNSGAKATIQGTTSISTLKGDLPKGSPWQTEYMNTNPLDTENGFHPQNLFRLFTKESYGDGSYQAYFKIDKTILSSSPNRNESNGLLIMVHAVDNENLYYAGLRVDGTAVIKKKIAGEYSTLAEVPVFAYAAYDKSTMPNLLPQDLWLGVKVDVRTLQNNQVDISLSIDIGGTGIWVPVAHALDTPQNDSATLPQAAHAGLRTDFMEVDMKDFKVSSL